MRTLTAEQKMICSLVGSGKSQRDAAAEVGVNEVTVSQWYHDHNGLGEAMAHWTNVYADRAVARLFGKAVGTLEKNMGVDDGLVSNQAADVALKRVAAIEKRRADLAKVELDREKWQAEQQVKQREADERAAAATGENDGVILIPDDNANWADG